jgi:hypothetical protein
MSSLGDEGKEAAELLCDWSRKNERTIIDLQQQVASLKQQLVQLQKERVTERQKVRDMYESQFQVLAKQLRQKIYEELYADHVAALRRQYDRDTLERSALMKEHRRQIEQMRQQIDQVRAESWSKAARYQEQLDHKRWFEPLYHARLHPRCLSCHNADAKVLAVPCGHLLCGPCVRRAKPERITGATPAAVPDVISLAPNPMAALSQLMGAKPEPELSPQGSSTACPICRAVIVRTEYLAGSSSFRS